MKNCANCKHLVVRDVLCFCGINGMDIVLPRLMGGPKKCECYEKRIKVKRKFEYPKKGKLE